MAYLEASRAKLKGLGGEARVVGTSVRYFDPKEPER